MLVAVLWQARRADFDRLDFVGNDLIRNTFPVLDVVFLDVVFWDEVLRNALFYDGICRIDHCWTDLD